jgi:hypothetical protein
MARRPDAHGGTIGPSFRLWRPYFWKHSVAHRRVGERVKPDKLAVGVVGEDVGALGRLPLEGDGGQDDDLVAIGDEVVRLGTEVFVQKLPL